jgi:hypothetical protein
MEMMTTRITEALPINSPSAVSAVLTFISV